MTIEVECIVVDPYRVVEIELAVGEFCPELWHGRDSRGQLVAKSIKRVATRHR
jgi:hypothetical protein